MALVLVMLITVGVTALAVAAIFLSSSASLISRGQEREEDMRNAADAGIELGRSALNGNPALFPDTGYLALFQNAPVYDASGNPIAGVTRSIYYGPTGSSTGQYGIFGSVLSVIRDRSGAVVVRRGELAQESFARFAYYTNSEGTDICFGSGDQIFGPMHTNDDMCIYSSGARFRNVVEVSGTITGKSYGTFDMGYTEHGAIVPLPTIADLAKLNTYATQGGMSFTTLAGGGAAQARTRIEFLALDLDGDGRVTGPTEGFFRIYQQNTGADNSAYVTASRPATANASVNCGDFHTIGGVAVFYSAAYHLTATALWASGHSGATSGSPATYTSAGRQTNATQSLQQGANSRCYLGGDEHLFTATAAGPNTFAPTDTWGGWVRYTTTPDAAVIAALNNPASPTVDRSLANRQLLAQYLWPLSRQFNPNSKGVIYVAGKVVVSGVVNSRVTLAASSNVIIGDDLRYAIAPGSSPCLASNMLGLLSPGTIYMADNTLNAPWDPGSGFRNYDDTNEEFLQAVALTLDIFTAENHTTGSNTNQPCEGTSRGRGCLYLTGGIIQGTRGAVGTTGGTGYLKRYSYDQCAFQTPPPYFPTTGRFTRNRYYEIDPVGFSVAQFYANLTPNH
jgi:hypothetical protein